MNKIEELKNELQDRIETLEAVIKIADELKITMTEKEIAERVWFINTDLNKILQRKQLPKAKKLQTLLENIKKI